VKYTEAVDELCRMRTAGLVSEELVDAVVHTHADIAHGALANLLVRDAEKNRDAAYAERNKLVCALSKIWPSHLAAHGGAEPWDSQWIYIVCIHSPVGQLTWHIHNSEFSKFEHLKLESNHWDGHTTEEKYTRLASLPKSSL